MPMSRPQRFLGRMAGFLLAVAAVAAALFPAIAHAFLANPALNGLILVVLLLGIAFIFRQVLMLRPEAAWLDAFRAGEVPPAAPRLLAPMARMLGERQGRLSLSAVATRSLLDGVGARLDESRETSRYLIGLLIFLGLLGTFWGLLQTVGAIGGVIGSLRIDGAADAGSVFGDLQQGLQAPLAGMGTAFSSSLFGLAGSLVLGFLELQAGQAQNRFYAELEDWLAGATRLSGGIVGDGGEGGSVPAYVQALLETTAESIERLQYAMASAEEGRRTQNVHLTQLTEKITALADQMRSEQQLMARLAESQMELRPVLAQLAATLAGGVNMGIDDATRTHIRNLELYTARLLEDSSSGRAEAVAELRNEIRILARTVAALGDGGER